MVGLVTHFKVVHNCEEMQVQTKTRVIDAKHDKIFSF